MATEPISVKTLELESSEGTETPTSTRQSTDITLGLPTSAEVTSASPSFTDILNPFVTEPFLAAIPPMSSPTEQILQTPSMSDTYDQTTWRATDISVPSATDVKMSKQNTGVMNSESETESSSPIQSVEPLTLHATEIISTTQTMTSEELITSTQIIDMAPSSKIATVEVEFTTEAFVASIAVSTPTTLSFDPTNTIKSLSFSNIVSSDDVIGTTSSNIISNSLSVLPTWNTLEKETSEVITSAQTTWKTITISYAPETSYQTTDWNLIPKTYTSSNTELIESLTTTSTSAVLPTMILISPKSRKQKFIPFTSPSPTTPIHNQDNLFSGTQIGIVVGVFAVVCAIAGFAIFLYRRRGQTQHTQHDQMNDLDEIVVQNVETHQKPEFEIIPAIIRSNRLVEADQQYPVPPEQNRIELAPISSQSQPIPFLHHEREEVNQEADPNILELNQMPPVVVNSRVQSWVSEQAQYTHDLVEPNSIIDTPIPEKVGLISEEIDPHREKPALFSTMTSLQAVQHSTKLGMDEKREIYGPIRANEDFQRPEIERLSSVTTERNELNVYPTIDDKGKGTEVFKPIDVQDWSAQDVLNWLEGQGIQMEIVARFAKHDINGPVLLSLSPDNLKNDLEIEQLGTRIRLQELITRLARSAQPASFDDPPAYS